MHDWANVLALQKKTKALMAASQYDGQEASTETMKCMFMSQQQNARQNHHTEIPNEVL